MYTHFDELIKPTVFVSNTFSGNQCFGIKNLRTLIRSSNHYRCIRKRSGQTEKFKFTVHTNSDRLVFVIGFDRPKESMSTAASNNKLLL